MVVLMCHTLTNKVSVPCIKDSVYTGAATGHNTLQLSTVPVLITWILETHVYIREKKKKESNDGIWSIRKLVNKIHLEDNSLCVGLQSLPYHQSGITLKSRVDGSV